MMDPCNQLCNKFVMDEVTIHQAKTASLQCQLFTVFPEAHAVLFSYIVNFMSFGTENNNNNNNNNNNDNNKPIISLYTQV